MPRKPSSLFLITDVGGSLRVERVSLANDADPDGIIQMQLQNSPGSTLYVIEDSKMDAYRAGTKVEKVDDPRLQEDPNAPQAPNP